MVAKSFQSLEILDEPHAVGGKPALYVTVRTKTGGTRVVRWYSDKEYAKMYPGEVPAATQPLRPLKEVLGFEKGYITIFKGNTYEDRDYFKLNAARYHKLWGWYFISTDELPTDIPEDVTPIRLNWEDISTDDNTLKNDAAITAAVESLIYEPDVSEYQGEIGDKLELVVTVEKAVDLDGFYGASTLYSMRDLNGDVYIWTTSSTITKLKTGETYRIRGKVKDHKIYKAQKQTILTRCALVK